MTSSIGAISNGNATSFVGRARPRPQEQAEAAFSKLDTGNKGYLDKTDLQNAFDQLRDQGGSKATGASSNVDDVLKQLDGDGDGKITKQEFSSGVKQVADQLDQQFQASRIQGLNANFSGQPPKPEDLAEQAFSQIDSSAKGYFDQSDLQKALDQVKQDATSAGNAAPELASAEDLFKTLDQDQDGKVTKQEFVDGVKNARPSDASVGTQGTDGAQKAGHGRHPDGPPPAGAAGPGGAAGAGGAGGASSKTSDTASSNETYDPADSNRDGTVSEQELSAYQQTSAYLLKHLQDGDANKSAFSSNDNNAQATALKILQLAHTYGTDASAANSNSVSVSV